ncbi:MAG TPA: DUF1059 domain-containing protein [Ornithinicoccus sp.]|nr:DUF1059 domain-containing protein [Ornithinicoccus sp.]
MSKEVHCRDLGFECDGVVSAETEEDVLAKATEHAQQVHGMTDAEVSADGFVTMARSNVHEGA